MYNYIEHGCVPLNKLANILIPLALATILSGCNKPEPDKISGEFFRFTVDVLYKGQPLRIEYPVACKFNISRNIDGDRSVDGASLAPSVFGVETPDGGALVIKTPNFCDYSKAIDANEVPSSYNPLIVHYQDAKSPTFGLGYYGAEAFDSPISVMKFTGSKTERISGEEFADWRQKNPHANWVTYERMNANPNIFNRTDWKPGDRHLATVCRGGVLYPLPQEAKDIIQDAWEDLGKPKYWSDKNKQMNVWTMGYVPLKEPSFGQRMNKRFGYNGDQEKGIIYPSETDFDMNRTDSNGKLHLKATPRSTNFYAIREKMDKLGVRANIVTRPEFRGFFFCNSHDDEHVTASSLKNAFEDYRGGIYQLDGLELQGKEGLVPHPWWPISWLAFIDDEYLVSNNEIRFYGLGGKL